MRIDEVMFSVERARGVKVLVLDACRNNPLLNRLVSRNPARSAELSRGLARVEASSGMIVAYSTQPDRVAVDGDGRNSPFTHALVKHIDEPGLEIGSLFRRVAIEVSRATHGRQLPETMVALRGEFYFNTRESDVQAWTKIRSSDDPARLSEFIRNYSNSALASEVRQRLEQIERRRAEREMVEREQAERATREQAERAAREQALRDQLAREREDRERIQREYAEREQAEQAKIARERAERERLEQAVREKADQMVREQAAREQALRDQLARERAEREDVERQRLERERQQTQAAGTQIAMVPPAATPSPALDAITGTALILGIKTELKRVGCLSGAVNDRWSAEARASVARFRQYAKLPAASGQAAPELLDAIRAATSRVCPLECGPRQIQRGGTCVAKICPRGQALTRDGECETLKPKNAAAAGRPDPLKYSNNFWASGTVRTGEQVSTKTPYGTLICIGGSLQAGQKRACHFR